MGDIMQWQADDDSDLEVYRICFRLLNRAVSKVFLKFIVMR
jgi:hypothetical protein